MCSQFKNEHHKVYAFSQLSLLPGSLSCFPSAFAHVVVHMLSLQKAVSDDLLSCAISASTKLWHYKALEKVE